MDGMAARPVLSADPTVHSLIGESTVEFLEEQCRQLKSDWYLQILPIKLRLATPSEDWRERRQEARDRGERPVDNQGTYRTASSIRRMDRLNFGSAQEVSLYKALLRRQCKLPAEATIAILPGPGTRVLGRTFWPDFVVTYRGRSGMIEVDGPHHHGRAAADHSRDALLSDAGVGHVGRITVEDTVSDAELDLFVERFLQRLTADHHAVHRPALYPTFSNREQPHAQAHHIREQLASAASGNVCLVGGVTPSRRYETPASDGRLRTRPCAIAAVPSASHAAARDWVSAERPSLQRAGPGSSQERTEARP
jgi:hypothetical protein